MEAEFFKDSLENLWLVGIHSMEVGETIAVAKPTSACKKCPGGYCEMVWNELMFINEHGDAKETQRVEFWTNSGGGTSGGNNGNQKTGGKYTIEQKSLLLDREEVEAVAQEAAAAEGKACRKDPLLLNSRKCSHFLSFVMVSPLNRSRNPNHKNRLEFCNHSADAKIQAYPASEPFQKIRGVRVVLPSIYDNR